MKKCSFSLVLVLFIACLLAGPALAQETPDMKDAMKCFYEKDFAKAKELFRKVISQDPQNSLALLYLLDCYAQDRNLQPILNELEEQALANKNSAPLMCHLGMGYFASALLKKGENFDDALTQFQEALKVDENISMGYLGMGIVYYKKRMIPRSRSYFMKASKLNANDVVALERLGEIFLLDDKNYSTAQTLFENIIQLYPSYPDGYFYYASASKALGEFDKAIENYEKAGALDPLGLTKGYYAAERIGDIYYHGLKNYPKAVEYYEKALRVGPENSYAKTMLTKAKAPPKDEEPPKKDDKTKLDDLKEKIKPKKEDKKVESQIKL
ncbi:MAG: tetratricopeptide repeat protein [Candidatus Eremiobacteraeota bacterium]|nr:tetratricopeptide repeat protein [Candidatus Eremiobacteraeota bacterium]